MGSLIRGVVKAQGLPNTILDGGARPQGPDLYLSLTTLNQNANPFPMTYFLKNIQLVKPLPLCMSLA